MNFYLHIIADFSKASILQAALPYLSPTTILGYVADHRPKPMPQLVRNMVQQLGKYDRNSTF